MNAQAQRGRRRRNQRTGRGVLGNIGNQLLPGIGGAVGNIADNLLGTLLGNLLGAKGMAAPVIGAGRSAARQINDSTESGTEEIAQIAVPGGTPAGTILLQALIAAPEIGVRLAKFAELWTKTQFLEFWVEVTSSNPTLVSGNYTIAIDPDPVQSYQSGPELPSRLMALTMATRANAWADNAVHMLPNPLQLFNKFHAATASDAELREYACGQLILATTTDYSDDCEYTVQVHWKVHFSRPDTQPEFGNLPANYILIAGYQSFTGATPIQATFTSAQVWVGGNTPSDGTYIVYDTGLIISMPVPGGFVATNITTVVVAGASTTLTYTTVTGALPTGVSGPQTPASYPLPGLFSSTGRRRLVRAGRALVHRLVDTRPHLEWDRLSHERSLVRLHKRATKDAYAEALKREALELTVDELRALTLSPG